LNLLFNAYEMGNLFNLLISCINLQKRAPKYLSPFWLEYSINYHALFVFCLQSFFTPHLIWDFFYFSLVFFFQGKESRVIMCH